MERCPALSISGFYLGFNLRGGVTAEIEFGAFKLQNMTSGGNNFSNIPENKMTKFCALLCGPPP